MIACGWCGEPTTSLDRCSHCGHEDPARPWVQRGQEPPTAADIERADRRRRIAAARRRLEDAGQRVTDEALAELLGVSARTVGRWREMSGQ